MVRFGSSPERKVSRLTSAEIVAAFLASRGMSLEDALKEVQAGTLGANTQRVNSLGSFRRRPG